MVSDRHIGKLPWGTYLRLVTLGGDHGSVNATLATMEFLMSTIEQNQEIVARLFDAFRAGDTARFDDLIADDYKQHNPGAGDGLDAVKAFFGPVGPVDVVVHRLIAQGDFVAVHSNYRTWSMAGVDIFRVVDGKIVEHWDVLQTVPETTVSGNDLFSQLS